MGTDETADEAAHGVASTVPTQLGEAALFEWEDEDVPVLLPFSSDLQLLASRVVLVIARSHAHSVGQASLPLCAACASPGTAVPFTIDLFHCGRRVGLLTG